MNKSTIWSVVSLVVVVVLIAVAVVYIAQPKSKYSEETIVGLAKALAAKEVTMYGAAWCPHCQAQKALFGKAFQYVPYVECPENEKLCIDKGVRGYPTWITKDGVKYEGEQTLEKLAELGGYSLGR